MKNYLCINGEKAELTAEQMRLLGITECGYTWEQIAGIAKEGKARDVFSIGQRFAIKIDGHDAEAEIIAFDHDEPNSITFALVNCFADHRMNHEWFNAGGWHCSEMRKWLNDEVFNELPDELKAVIKPVTKITGIGAGIKDEKIASKDKLFLFSQVEVFGYNRFSVAGEGTQYEGFKKNGAKKLDVDGDASTWWIRSPYGSYATHFCIVASGGAANGNYASASAGVAFGFCD